MNVTVSAQQAARVQRCLVVLGFICEHSKKCTAVFRRAAAAAAAGGGDESGYGGSGEAADATGGGGDGGGDGGDSGQKKGNKRVTTQGQGQGQSQNQAQVQAQVSVDDEELLAAPANTALDEEAASRRLVDLGPVSAGTLNGTCFAAVLFALGIALPQVQVGQ